MSSEAIRHPLHAVANEAVHLEHIGAVLVFVLVLTGVLMAVDFSAASLLGG
jgi:hypothetical protein